MGFGSLRELFRGKVERSGDCVVWTGARCGKKVRYGHCYRDTVSWQVHRLSFVVAFGAIPDGLEIDHTCGSAFSPSIWKRSRRQRTSGGRARVR